MYCGNCGKKTSDANRYCEHCNFDLIHIQKLLNESDDEESDDEFRSAAEIARRCLVLCSVVAASHKENGPKIVSWLKDEGLWKDVSPKERSLFQSKKPTNGQLVNASWKVEALHLLLWALRLIPSIEDNKTRAERLRLQALLPYLGPTSEFIANSELRSEDEIREMNEKIYEAHWLVRDAETNSRALPKGIDTGVLIERHRAINWLMGYGAQAWDDVTTDT
jgi:hypothetical protein